MTFQRLVVGYVLILTNVKKKIIKTYLSYISRQTVVSGIRQLVVVFQLLHFEQFGDQICASGGKEDFLRVVRKAKPSRRLPVGQRFDPLEEVVASCAVRHGDVTAVDIGDECEVRLEAARSEEFRQEGMEEALVEVVVDLAAVDRLRHQGDEGVPWDLLRWKVRTTLEDY